MADSAEAGNMPIISREWRCKEKITCGFHDTVLIGYRKLVFDMAKTDILDTYWNSHKAQDDSDSVQAESSLESSSRPKQKPVGGGLRSGNVHARTRSASDGAAIASSGYQLTPHHPAWNLPPMLDTFGPLLLPIYRACLLRKRILITGNAPVQQICDFGR